MDIRNDRHLVLGEDYLEWSVFISIQFLGFPHRLTSLGRDVGKGRSIFHFNRFSKILSGCMDVVISIAGTRLKRRV